MSNKKIVGSVFLIAVIVASVASLPLIFKDLKKYLPVSSQKYINSVSQDKVNGDCDGKEKICVVNNGKIEVKSASSKETEAVKPKCNSPEECNVAHANNVAAAVSAIRNYTKIPDLDLSMMENSVPTGVTYYCTKDKKCWAVNNQTHEVVESTP